MNIAKKELDQTSAVVTIHVEKADYAEKVDKTLGDYRKKANMPGFRPGMVPLNLVKKLYGKAILADEINKLVSENLFDYIKKNNMNVLGEPLPNETEQPEIDFDTQEDFDFVFDIAIAPEFEISLSKKDKIDYYSIAVTDEMVDGQIKSYANRYGKYADGDTVEENDMVKGELHELENGAVKDGGVHVEGAILTPGYMKDEDSKKLFLGAKVGDVVTFNPKKAFENVAEVASLLKISKDEAEKFEADCQIKIEGITRYQAAEVNQELFDKVYGEGVVKSEDEFRNKAKENLQKSWKADSEYKFTLDVRDMLLKKMSDVTFPDAFLKRWLLSANKDLTETKLEEDYPKILDDLKWHLAKDKLAKAYDVKVESPDVEAYAKEMARAQFAQYGMMNVEDDLLDHYAKDMLKKEETVKNIVDKVAENKVVEAAKAAVKVTEKEVPLDEFTKLFETK